MKFYCFALILYCLATALPCSPSFAGTLDNAPFKIKLPDADWTLDDSTSQPMGQDVSLVASLTNTKSGLKSLVITEVIKPSETALDELCTGLRESFKNPVVKEISDEDTTFLSHKARAFAYEVTHAGQTTYNEAVVFIVGNTGWTIAVTGPAAQKDQIKRMLAFYHAKP